MNEIFQALFEGSLLSKVGMPAFDVVRSLKSIYEPSLQVGRFFQALEHNWLDRQASSSQLASFFQERANENEDFLIASAFSELSVASGMIEVHWKDAACTYLLKKKLSRKEPSQIDVDYAMNVISFFSPQHSFRRIVFNFSNDPLWTGEISTDPKNMIDADRWLRQFAFFPTAIPSPLSDFLKKELERLGQGEQLSHIEAEWCHYVQAQRLLT